VYSILQFSLAARTALFLHLWYKCTNLPISMPPPASCEIEPRTRTRTTDAIPSQAKIDTRSGVNRNNSEHNSHPSNCLINKPFALRNTKSNVHIVERKFVNFMKGKRQWTGQNLRNIRSLFPTNIRQLWGTTAAHSAAIWRTKKCMTIWTSVEMR